MAYYNYKCRMCNEIYTKFDLTWKSAMDGIIDLSANHPLKKENKLNNSFMQKLYDTHICNELNIGISDLIGITREADD